MFSYVMLTCFCTLMLIMLNIRHVILHECISCLLMLFSPCRQLHTPTNLLLLSLAVSDFLWGLVVAPFDISHQTSCWFLGDVLCVLCAGLSYCIASASIGNMLLISVDRYVAVCYPLQYSTRVTVKRVQVCSCLCWLCSVVYNNLIINDEPGRHRSCYGECRLVLDYIPGVIDIVVSFIVPISVIIILYMRVFMVAVSQAQAMRAHRHTHTATNLQPSVSVTARRSELKAARNLGVVILLFLMCFCPFYFATFENDTASNEIIMPLSLLNSCLNPMIYALLYPWFRKTIRLIVTLQILRPDSCDTSLL